ncbi:hypothetical protein [Hymenobacter lapidarius]|nr:hypothetical protein [Hymenobacter lapidarius]
MSSFFWRSLVVFILLLATSSAQAQTINVDAATRYWEITDGLR